LTQRSRFIAAVLGLLLLAVVLSACGAAPTAQNWPGLTLDGNTLYVISGSPQKVLILDAETGAQKQSFPQNWTDLVGQDKPRGVVYWSPVTVGDGVAFVGFADSGNSDTWGLYAFDPETGQRVWKVPVESLVEAAPTYAEGVVYVGDTAGYVHAIDVETGSEKAGWPFQATDAVWASPLVVEGRVYIASMDHHLYCLDAASGQVLWDHEVGGAMAAQPILEDGILYVGAFDGKMYALNADTGEPVEGFEFKAGNWIWSEALMADGKLYVTALDGKLYALEPSSGAVISPYPYNSASGNGKEVIRAAPVQAGDAIVVATESGRVIAVRDAAQKWGPWSSGTAAPQGSIYTTPIVEGDTIYVVLMNGQVWTLNAETGQEAKLLFSPPASK